ncbi:pyrimidine 5-nucleotidase [Vararia minispora EC-137]|uniref:Pyrimidine 5-nucleotidase n=1 Tax=Vararia minispora EC-137 TaxID=1314806 RepID=A0ACB8QG29_9AGAM|nr:pyrimidine 5-nucleotidase [Vararia minispora EC-137]
MLNARLDDRLVVFFDIDNTLYSASSNISHAMGQRIHAYFTGLGFPDDEASDLHHKYYTQYGLALRGLIRHHSVDPLDFDRKCDQSLPLEDMIKPDPALRQLFQDIDRTKCRVWALTNAYKPHAERVLRILQLDGLVDGLIYCDYAQPNFSCKPEREYYEQAMRTAHISDPSKILFVDDSRTNVLGARAVGWTRSVHFCERGLKAVEGGQPKVIGNDVTKDGDDVMEVSSLQQLRKVWKDIFKHSA